MSRQITLIFILFLVFKSYADMGPKHSESIYIKFKKNNFEINIDSLYVIVLKNQFADTAFLLPFETMRFWTRPTLNKKKDQYELFTHGSIKCFKIVAFINHIKLESEYLLNYPGNLVYNIAVESNQLVIKSKEINLIDESTLFHQDWLEYIKSLLLTILVELFLGFYFFYKFKDNQNINVFIILFIIVNLLTHFCLWFVYSHFDIPLFFLELCVVIFETMFWKFYLRIRTSSAVLISFLTNFISWAVGAIVSYFI